MAQMTISRASRFLVVVSTIAAALVESALANAYSPQVFWIALAGFALMLAVGRRFRSVALPILMAALYLTPAMFLVSLGFEGYGLDVIWILPLLGVILSDRDAWQRWSLPARWQWPLVTWSLLVAIVWPIVFLREADFAPWILPLPRVSNTSVGIGPWEVGQNVAYFALGHTLGILFIDALFRWYAGALDRFRRDVLVAAALAAGAASLVAVYQGFFDLSFLNSGFWTYMIRASGTLADPNKLGSVVSFWTIGAVVLARRLPKPWPMSVTVVAIVLGVAAVWLTGSRTGLAALTVTILAAAIEAVRSWRDSGTRLDPRRVLPAGAAAIVLGTALVFVLQQASTHTIVARGALFYIPLVGDHSIRQTANEWLWERFGYGPAAIEMIKEHPIDGVGVGVFHSQAYDFGRLAGYTIPQPDNAQNWFRHTFAELGLLGSLPVIWWCVVLVMLMFTRPRGDRLSFGMLRGVLLGFGVASTFGMPAQSIAIAVTFWIFAFWLFTEAAPAKHLQPATWSKGLLIAAAALVAVHVGMTTVDALGDLRPQNRAQRWDWYYRYGYYTNDNDGTDLEPDPGGNPIGRRWTMRDSLAVIKVQGKTLKFVAWVDHPDADVKPVHTRVWADSNLVYEGDLRRAPLMLDIPATPGKTHMVIETSIDRVWRPSDSGSRDRRELGLSIRDWTWQ
jgi:O-antigen ligase